MYWNWKLSTSNLLEISNSKGVVSQNEDIIEQCIKDIFKPASTSDCWLFLFYNDISLSRTISIILEDNQPLSVLSLKNICSFYMSRLSRKIIFFLLQQDILQILLLHLDSIAGL